MSAAATGGNVINGVRVPDPPGYLTAQKEREILEAPATAAKAKEDAVRAYKLAWETALGQVKTILTFAFTLYISGNSVQVFSLGAIGSAIWQPSAAVWSSRAKFAPFAVAGAKFYDAQLVYCLFNLAPILMALYKAHSMGLLPTHYSDWVGGTAIPVFAEQTLASIRVG